jgi:hypothetical protein
MRCRGSSWRRTPASESLADWPNAWTWCHWTTWYQCGSRDRCGPRYELLFVRALFFPPS